MPKRTVTVVLASFLAGAPLTAISLSAARASNDCVSAPTSQAPPGSHWYYHTDHAAQRDCWYVREVPAKRTQQVPAKSAPLAKILISPQTLTTAQGSIEDARAELPAPAPEQAPPREDEPVQATASETVPSEEKVVAKAPADGTHRSMLMAALALAGIAGSVIFKLGSLRRTRRSRFSKRRGAIWAAADRARRKPSPYPPADDFARGGDFVRDLDRVGDLKARSREIFSQLSERVPR